MDPELKCTIVIVCVSRILGLWLITRSVETRLLSLGSIRVGGATKGDIIMTSYYITTWVQTIIGISWSSFAA